MQIPILRRNGDSGLNFIIIGGTVQPVNPKKNTIWINTDQEIVGWQISFSEPETPKEGMIWLKIGNTSSTDIDLGKDGENVVLRLNGAHQYLAGAFVLIPSKLYDDMNGEWIDLKTKLVIWDGNTFATGYTQLGHRYAEKAGSLTTNSGYLQVTGPNTSWAINMAYFTVPIDVTPYSTVRVKYSAYSYDAWFGLTTSPSSPGLSSSNYSQGWSIYYNDPGDKAVWVSGDVNLDISNLEGKQYFAFACVGSGANNYTGYFQLKHLEFIL